MKGLEALDKIKNDDFPLMVATYPPIPTTMNGYTKEELFEIIEKELKALEIIKNKNVELEYLKCCEDYEQYKTLCSYWNEITEEECDLLKEVLG